MKTLALIAGFLMLAAAAAGFFGVLALSTIQCAILAVAGVIAVAVGFRRGAAKLPPRGPGHDMRDLNGI